MDCFGLFWTVLDCFGLFWIVLDCFGLFWTVLDCFGLQLSNSVFLILAPYLAAVHNATECLKSFTFTLGEHKEKLLIRLLLRA